MPVECECGEPLEAGRTFCRRCGRRVGQVEEPEELTRELDRDRPAFSQPPPSAQPPPPPPPPGRGGMDPKVIVGGAVVVVVLAVAGYAFATLGSDGESDPNQAKVLDVNGKQERDSEQTDSEEADSEVTNANDRQADSGSKGSDSERPSGMDEVPSIPNFREDCGNEVYAAGSASCAFSTKPGIN